MCSVSAVSQYYTETFPQRFPQIGQPFLNPLAVDNETRDMMRRALELLDRIDKRLGDIECQDAEKAKFMESLRGELR